MRGFARLGAAVAFALPLLVTAAPGVHATTAVAGDAAFSGQATLNPFPCPPPPPFGTGPCAGNFSGSWTGHLTGAGYDVVWATTTPDSVSATFNYYELQCLDGTETAIGFAQGSGTAHAGPGQVQGKVLGGGTFPYDVLGVTATFSFQWTRVGTSAVISFSPITVTLTTSAGTITPINTPQNGTATFVPTQAGSSVPTCTNQWNVAGVIAGDIPLAQAS